VLNALLAVLVSQERLKSVSRASQDCPSPSDAPFSPPETRLAAGPVLSGMRLTTPTQSPKPLKQSKKTKTLAEIISEGPGKAVFRAKNVNY
jgi:hypothetical protein